MADIAQAAEVTPGSDRNFGGRQLFKAVDTAKPQTPRAAASADSAVKSARLPSCSRRYARRTATSCLYYMNLRHLIDTLPCMSLAMAATVHMHLRGSLPFFALTPHTYLACCCWLHLGPTSITPVTVSAPRPTPPSRPRPSCNPRSPQTVLIKKQAGGQALERLRAATN